MILGAGKGEGVAALLFITDSTYLPSRLDNYSLFAVVRDLNQRICHVQGEKSVETVRGQWRGRYSGEEDND